MQFADLAATSQAVAATTSRSAKIALLAECLGQADPVEGELAVSYLAGEVRQRRTGVGWAALRDAPPPAGTASLTVAEVDRRLERLAALSGAGSATARRAAVAGLLAEATADEQRMLRGLLAGDLRQGALEGVMAEAVARSVGLPAADVRRAAMLAGSLPAVARAAFADGRAGVAAFGLQVGRPVGPMLASTAESVPDALARLGGAAAVDWKLDGVRVQIHRDGAAVAIFTRTLEEITDRLPEVVAAARALPVRSVVLDGEVIALAADGRPRRFQETAGRVASRGPRPGSTEPASRVPLSTYVFDVMHLDGEDLLGRPAADRFATAGRLLPPELAVPRVITAEPHDAAAHYDAALAHGHEGVVVKSLTDGYAAGRRGGGWLKVKPRHTLDLVVLAVEWGSGRRRGWLSNLHLGARDPVGGGYVMLGKTFKGLTDERLRWQTGRLLELEVRRNDWQVFVRPELVVEIAFDGVQTSTRYPGGMALRFARVLRYRPDKRADEADTVAAVREIYRR